MPPSYKTIKKFRTPQVSAENAYVINVYRDGNFLVSYLYSGWDKPSVEEELQFLKHRFPEYRNYRVVLG